MSESHPPTNNLEEEFRTLGDNLVQTLKMAWDSPERKKLQQEIESGLSTLGKTIKNEAETFSQTPGGQRIKEDVDDLRQRIETGKVEEKMRQEIITALRTVNSELQKVIDRLNEPGFKDTNNSSTPNQGNPDHNSPSQEV